MGGGGSGDTSVLMRNPTQEKKTVGNWYGFQEGQLNKFVGNQPLLSTGQQGALGFWDQLFGQGSALTGAYNNFIAPTLASGGALTPQESRDVSQQTRNIASAQGTARSPGALGTELLNRDQYKQQRFNTALGQAGQYQGLQTGGLNQLLGVQNAETQNFTSLTNPVLGYLGNLFGGNQQASIAQAQINQAGNQASQSKGAGITGGAINLLGSAAAAY